MTLQIIMKKIMLILLERLKKKNINPYSQVLNIEKNLH